MAEIIQQPETESGLSKQLLGNFHTENLFDHKQTEVKDGGAYKKACIAMKELMKSISTSMEL